MTFANKVTNLVNEFIAEYKIPGVTVAVTKNGQLILSNGYGLADTKKKTPMTADHRACIGSVTKATVTGPSAFKAMAKEKIDPTKPNIYGPTGLFKESFAQDQAQGIGRHTPIIDLAIGPEDHVFAWYLNSTFSSGSSNHLDLHTKPAHYSMPPGRTPIDIRAIGITKDGKVYVWYEDGKRSIGTPSDLAFFSPPSEEPVKLPKGKSMLDIVGIDIAKSNDHVYVWYDDGTFSSGTSMNFGAYPEAGEFKVAPGAGGTSYDIRGVGIASNDHVYAWFSNGKASSGMSNKLDRYIAPYDYSVPVLSGIPDWGGWYRSISAQNLLDHRSGFVRDGDVDGAAGMFGEAKEKLTYRQIHQHFLRTRKLLSEPGSSDSYSSHGFGFCTLLIQEITGEPYYPYVRDHHLAPLGLGNAVVPRTNKPDDLDASDHAPDGDGDAVPHVFQSLPVGLAAGGFRASAKSLARIMLHLEAKYTRQDIDNMGWMRNKLGKLLHGGATGGGCAYVAMFPAGYILDKHDVSRVNIALVMNVSNRVLTVEPERTTRGELALLADRIAIEVPVG